MDDIRLQDEPRLRALDDCEDCADAMTQETRQQDQLIPIRPSPPLATSLVHVLPQQQDL
jgi:hypothetical protein